MFNSFQSLFHALVFLFLSLFQNSSLAVVKGNLSKSHGSVVALTSEGWIYCTGVFVDSKTILTAAHCYDHDNKGLGIYLGSGVEGGNLNTIKADIIRYNRNQVTLHPLYGKNNVNSTLSEYDLERQDLVDLAVIQLEKDIEGAVSSPLFSGYERNETAEEAAFDLVGFGGHGDDFVSNQKYNIEYGEKYSLQLKLKASINSEYYKLPTQKGHVFRGDSGGPLFKSVSGQWQLAGIHSSVHPFNSQRSWHTRIDRNTCWIYSLMGRSGSCFSRSTETVVEKIKVAVETNNFSELDRIDFHNLKVDREKQMVLMHLAGTEFMTKYKLAFERLITQSIRSENKSLIAAALHASQSLPTKAVISTLINNRGRFIYYGESDLDTLIRERLISIGVVSIPILKAKRDLAEKDYIKHQLQLIIDEIIRPNELAD